MSNAFLEVRDVHKSFALGNQRVDVLSGVDMALEEGSAAAITGPSGSGKSTLLHLVGTLDEPTSGTITIGDEDPFQLSEAALAHFRNRTVGFVFQDHHLLPQYTVLENVLLPALAFETANEENRAWARELLDLVGLEHRLAHRPAELSGGERQRVAVARALINRPRLLLCDEPTGNLDRANAMGIVDLLFQLHEASGRVLVVVTHSAEIASRFPFHLALQDGRCVAA